MQSAFRTIHRTIAAVLLIGLVALTPASSSQAAADTSGAGGIRQIGTFDRIGDDARAIFGDRIVPKKFFGPNDAERSQNFLLYHAGTMVSIPEVRQLWQIFTPDLQTPGTLIAVRDMDSLKIIHTLALPVSLTRGSQALGAGQWMHAIDPVNKRLFMVDNFLNESVIEFDLRTFTHRSFLFSTVPVAGAMRFTQTALAGMTYDRHSNSLLGLFGQANNMQVANTNSYVLRYDLTNRALSQPRLIRSCNGPLPSADAGQTLSTTVLPTKDFIYVPCQRAGLVGAVVRMPRTSFLDPSGVEDPAVGPVQLETALIDEGAGRIFLITIKGEIWAFDVATMSFVGVVGANADSPTKPPVGYGLDRSTGRLYFQSPTYGFGVADGRFFPLPQARTLPVRKGGQEEIISDAKTGRIFVLEGLGTGKDIAYKIYDAGPAAVPPPPPDPDGNTADVPEREGVTDSRYFGNGSGYGVRALMAGGAVPVVPAPAVGVVAPTADAFAKYVTSRCWFADRELVAGRVVKAEYDTGSTAAQAIGVALDERSKLDMDQPSRCDPTLRDPRGATVLDGIFRTAPQMKERTDNPDPDAPRWNQKPASCSSSTGGEEATSKATGSPHPFGAGAAQCPLPGGRLKATAESGLVGGVQVGRAQSSAEVWRDTAGIHSRSESLAADVVLGEGLVRIGEIRAIAESVSNGRPSKDRRSSLTVTIRNVIINGTNVCPGTCDTTQVVTALNQFAAGRVQFRTVSGLDESLLRGTPRGALTAVQKSIERQASDQALVGDFTTEVPALEMIVYNDNSSWGRARQVYQFAGVSTAATYNIVMLPTGIGSGDGDADLSGDGSTAGGGDGVGDAGSAPGDSGFAEIAVSSEPSAAEDSGGVVGAVRRALRALVRGVRLFFTDPRTALLLFTGWGLFCLPAALARRRALLNLARAGDPRPAG